MSQKRKVTAAREPLAHSHEKTSSLDRKRRWLFRLVAALGVPGLILGLVECGLRTVGYGHPTTFFIPSSSGTNHVLVDNTWFGLRFFPPSLARSPAPLSIQMPKPHGVYRIFLFGESAALGDPRPSYGAGRYLEVLLNERFPGIKFEVVCVAMTAINSHAILSIARECQTLDGDLWILYAGHNEMAGPFGATTVFGAQAPPWLVVRAQLAAQRLRLGQLIAHGMRLTGAGEAHTGSWGGLKMFTHHSVPLDLPARKRVYDNFQRNLCSIVRAAHQYGIPIVLSSVASNLRDCAPFGPPQDPTPNSAHDDQAELSGRRSELPTQIGQLRKRANELKDALVLAPRSSHLHFRLAQCLLALGEVHEARMSFEKARDFDTLPFRADSNINAIIAQVVSQSAHAAIAYVDAQAALARENADLIPGLESFYEHVHLNPNGNYRLACTWADTIARFVKTSLGDTRPGTWLGLEDCARRLALTDWNRHAAIEEMLRRILDAPFTSQLNHAAHLDHLQGQRIEIRERLRHTSPLEFHALYERSIRDRPGDHWLHHNYAEFLTNVGDLARAAEQMNYVRDLVPHHYAAHLQLGRLLARLNHCDEARQAIREALRRRPDLSDAYLELGQIAARQRNFQEALAHFNEAILRRPGGVGAYLQKADVLAALSQRPAAIRSLRDAILLQPGSWEARYLLGIELAKDNQITEATAELTEAVRLQPEHVLSRLNLGNLLARQQRYEDALVQFRHALRIDPANRQAQDSIAALAAPSFDAHAD